jgi:hypothetical protein
MSLRNAALAAVVLVAACGPLTAQTPGAPAPQAPAEVAQQESPAPQQSSADAYCARSLCGCWRPATLHYRAQVVDADGATVEGVDAICRGETEPLTQTSAAGVLEFEIATQQSPGCGYQRCRIMTLSDPQARFANKEVIAVSTNGATLILEPHASH